LLSTDQQRPLLADRMQQVLDRVDDLSEWVIPPGEIEPVRVFDTNDVPCPTEQGCCARCGPRTARFAGQGDHGTLNCTVIVNARRSWR
jgi:hypothetical protein